MKDIVAGENFGNSDHQKIRFNIAVTYLNDKKKKYRNYLRVIMSKLLKWQIK